MPMERLDKPTPLDEVLASIRAADPTFNSVVVRDVGVPEAYPTLPAMTLKNVTVGQFLQFVRSSYPGFDCMRIDGPTGALYSVRISAEGDNARRAMGAQDRNRLHLYRLTEVIQGQAAEIISRNPKADKTEAQVIADVNKEATAQVLSLLQAALDQTDEDGASVLKMHEPTMTLMFKGSDAKQDILEEALSTLKPRNGSGFFDGKPSRSRTSSSLGSTPANPFDYNPGSTDAWRRADDLFQKTNSEIAATRAELAKRSAELDALRAQKQAEFNASQPKAVPVLPPVGATPPAKD